MSAVVMAQDAPGRQAAVGQSLRWPAGWGFLALGLSLSVLGTAVPGARAAFGISLSDAGLLVVVNAASYTISVFVGGMAAERFGQRRVLQTGVAALLAGIVLFAGAPSWLLVLFGIGLIGSGEGVVEGGLNALISEQSGAGRTASLNLYHGLLGLGAVLAPLLAGLLLTAGLSWRWLYLPSALATLGLAWSMRWVRLPAPSPPATASPIWLTLNTPVVWLLAIMLCLYAGVEMMIGTWAFSHLQAAFAADEAQAGLATALYWGGITLGRLLAGLAGTQVSAHQWIVVNILATAIALALLVTAPTIVLAAAGLVLIGLTLANIYPAVIAVAGQAYPHAINSVTGALVAAGGLGVTLFPWLTGVVAETAGLAAALAGGLGLLLLMLAVEMVVITWQRRTAGHPRLTSPRADRAANRPAPRSRPLLPKARPARANRRPGSAPALLDRWPRQQVGYTALGLALLALGLGVTLAIGRHLVAGPGDRSSHERATRVGAGLRLGASR